MTIEDGNCPCYLCPHTFDGMDDCMECIEGWEDRGENYYNDALYKRHPTPCAHSELSPEMKKHLMEIDALKTGGN